MPSKYGLNIVAVSLSLGGAAGVARGGVLTPPAGPIAPTHKSLTEVEPRIAVNATNTPGDATNIYKITQPGSYYLAGNVLGEAGKNGITASGGLAGEVTLDLNGYTVRGVSGSLKGITGGTVNVHNGTVDQWGQEGVSVQRGILRDLHCTSNGGHGIIAVWGVIVSHCVVESNVGDGIHIADVSRIEACVSKGNTAQGIHLDGAGTISGCVVYNNDGGGIDAGLASQVTDCMLFSNPVAGIRVTNGARVADNQITSATIGILVVGSGTRVLNNGISGAVTGIVVEDDGNRIDGNSINGVTTGIAANPSTGNLIIRNSVSGATTGYDLAAGNAVGPIVGVATIATDENPHANYEY